MQKGDEVDVVVVVQIKLVLAEQFSNEFHILLSRSHHPEKLQANSLHAHPTQNTIVAGTTCEGSLCISTS